jgi:hypothetical protein
MPYNLESPNGVIEPFDFVKPNRWIAREMLQIECASVREVVMRVAGNLDDFVQWPTRAVLLWEGCDRIPPANKRQKYHRYPEVIVKLARKQPIPLDTRPNGPATTSFLLAGGTRPERFGSTNAWSTHHLYSGKFPYIGRETTMHAPKECIHFTQSAGVVAIHPIADALCDEYPFFAWSLRAIAFQRFGYDPDGVFSPTQNRWGFVEGHTCEVLYSSNVDGET